MKWYIGGCQELSDGRSQQPWKWGRDRRPSYISNIVLFAETQPCLSPGEYIPLTLPLLRGGSTHSPLPVNHCLTVTVVTHTPCSLLLELATQISILNLYVLGLSCYYRTIYILSLLAFPSCTLHPPLSLDILKSCFQWGTIGGKLISKCCFFSVVL